MLDMGCGYGALSHLIGSSLGFKEVHGIDIDGQRGRAASERGLQLSTCNLERENFPYPNEHFEFVTTFGVLDHLRNLDNPISEAHRVLKPGGSLAISTTNLGSWINRIALLMGYQPRNLEISSKGLFGVNELYRSLYSCTEPMRRITGITLRALEEYLKFNGFSIVRRWGTGLTPLPDKGSGALVRLVDRFFSKRASWAARYIILASKRT